jgi:hypothetical protein
MTQANNKSQEIEQVDADSVDQDDYKTFDEFEESDVQSVDYKLDYIENNTGETIEVDGYEEIVNTGISQMDTGKKLKIQHKKDRFDVYIIRRRPYDGVWKKEASQFEGGIDSVARSWAQVRYNLKSHEVTDEQIQEVKEDIFETLPEKFTIQAGSQGKDWYVIPEDREGQEKEYRVEYSDEDKYQDVTVSEDGMITVCSGTYFDHNSTCPHIEASQKVESHIQQQGESKNQ